MSTEPEPGKSRQGFWAFIRYLFVGGFNTLLDLALFTCFVVVVGLLPVVANVASTTITMCVSYLLNRTIVFRSNNRRASTAAGFVAVTLFSGLLVQSAVIASVMWVGQSYLGAAEFAWFPSFAKICAMGVGMITNFLGYRWLFRQR